VPRRGLDTERVVEAAVKLADDGLGEVTLARLARTLGVRAPSLYSHVDGRDGLQRLISLRAVTELADSIGAAAVGLAGEDALRATAHAYRAYALAHPGRYEATLVAPRGEDAQLEAAAARLFDMLAGMLRAWRLEGDDVVDAIRIVRSALHGFVVLERTGGFAMPRDLDASFERLVDTVLAGLSEGGSGSARR
jgi:AcrR family transcriptional regulator